MLYRVRLFFFMVVGGLALTLLASASHAATLNLYNAYPDIFTNNLTVTYTYNGAGQGTFVATGNISPTDHMTWKLYQSLADRSAWPPIYTAYDTGNFSMTAVVNVSGTGSDTVLQAVSGSLLVEAGNGGVTTPFFTSNVLYAVGYNVKANGNGSDGWQFLFGNGGGLYGGIADIGVNLFGGGTTYYPSGNVYNTSPINFYSNFQSTRANTGYADTFVTPLPTAALMALTSPALLFLTRRKKFC